MKTTNKTCTQCAEEKHITCFNKRTLSKDGHASLCAQCNSKRTMEWAQKNGNKVADNRRRHALKEKYGITPEQYNELLEKQNYCCAICERHEDQFKLRLAVDHNHKTREVRGLLCNYCNHRVIGRHTDGNKLRMMADYIEQGTGWLVPLKKKRPVKRKPK